jgi:peptide/nickel transport system substrate-binding protein
MGVTWPMFHVWVIAMNNPPTDDSRVRKAMRLCTDRKALVDGLWDGKAEVPTAHQFPEYGQPLYIDGLQTIKYDPEEAKRLLKKPATMASRWSPSSRAPITSTAISPRR